MLQQPSSEYRGFRQAGIRLSEEMLPELGRLYASRTRPMLRVMHAFDKAHAVMLVEEGLLRREHGTAILLWRVADHCVRDLGWFAELLPALHVRREHMREEAWHHWATATDLAGALVRERDLPWRTAHQIVGILVRLGEERGLGPDRVTPELLDEAAVLYHGQPVQPVGLTAAAIREALDPGRFIAARTLRGGPAPGESMRQAALLGDGLRADEATVAGIRARLVDSARRLEEAIDRIVGA